VSRLPLIALTGSLFALGFSACSAPSADVTGTAQLDPTGKAQTATIVVEHGYKPNVIVAKPGVPLTLVFDRKESGESCAKELVIPAVNVNQPLPDNDSVSITIPAQKAGEMPFACGMDMMRGKIVFQDTASDAKDAPKAEAKS
jgi:Cu+-exporting ATPase